MSVEIYLSINNNEEVIQLPAPPEQYEIDSPFGSETFESIMQAFNLPGTRGLKTLEISSFFPVRNYPFLQNRSMWGMDYVDTIERWRDRRLPMRLIIVSRRRTLSINMPITIDDFQYSTDKSGDIKYTMSIREFTLVQVGD
ncbi:hypothetical protein [Tindallia californiensis]|uniref:Uncharacterized protein n=1 Tax=Tindallia californiensis TaxID=159292 RepID=A0A1H3R298_9FIRM|nr:hypothetical protein [Tindallia californiensis]SDZ19421.1 hypothetical protein SAMN05192546_11181 [Tindallia californiensis]